jgi:hypothetical protein
VWAVRQAAKFLGLRPLPRVEYLWISQPWFESTSRSLYQIWELGITQLPYVVSEPSSRTPSDGLLFQESAVLFGPLLGSTLGAYSQHTRYTIGAHSVPMGSRRALPS